MEKRNPTRELWGSQHWEPTKESERAARELGGKVGQLGCPGGKEEGASRRGGNEDRCL